MTHYFAYGALMGTSSMYVACPEARKVGPARLDGYRVEFNVASRQWAGGAVNAMPDPDGTIWGVLWDIPDEDFARFDTFQGSDASLDVRVDVEVEGPVGRVAARTFRVDSHSAYIRPTEAYMRHLQKAISTQGLPQEAEDLLLRADRFPDTAAPTI
ncbi:MAG: gamma-glutamylcyclotransferase family protein [Actinomycetota bacterium]